MTASPEGAGRPGCRVLLVNPNTSAFMTRRMVDLARSVAAPGTLVRGVEATRGVPYIASRAEAALGGAIVLDLMAEHGAGQDVAIVAAFGDPGLAAARELMPIPVVGLAEAAMLTACMLGRRFSIVSFSTALGAWYRDCVEDNGLASRLASLRLAEGPFADVETVGRDKRDRLIELAREAVDRDGADAVILAGAPLTGLAAEIDAAVPVPLVDPVVAALKQAELLGGLGLRRSAGGEGAAPPKATTGLSPALADLLETARPSRHGRT